jgi:hypothetical protein
MTAVDLVARVRGGVVGDGQDLVIFCGSGATAAVAKLVGLLELAGPPVPAGPRPVVFVGPYEHHSNLLPWRESAAEVVAVGEDGNGQVDLLAAHGHRLLGDYQFDPCSGQWRHRLAATGPVPSLAELLEGRSDPGPGPGVGEDALAGYLGQARELLAAAGPVTVEAGPSWLPPQLERLRDFHLPTTAWGGVPAR